MKTIIKIFLFFTFSSVTFAQFATVIPSPNPSSNFNIIRGISGTSSTNIWAVGQYDETGNVDFKNLVMRWNGSNWNVLNVPSPNSDGDLWGVTALSENSAWAVGMYSILAGLAQAQILRWNGSQWSSVSNLPATPNGSFLWDVDALSENEVWAAGGLGGSPASLAVSYRWNGAQWEIINVPPVGQRRNRFTCIDAISSDNIWAGGSYGDVLGQFKFLIMKWNGSSWVHVPSPVTNQNGDIDDIKAVSANDIWAIGSYTTGGSLFMHWDGSSWTVVQSPGSAGALAVVNSNNVFSVGSNVAHWNGNQWSVVDNLSQLYGPALRSTTLLPNGEIWAAGRYLDNNNNLMTLTVKFNSNNVVTGKDPVNNVPDKFALYQNYPNPFNPETEIKFDLPSAQYVSLKIYDINGKEADELISGIMEAGTHKIKWNAASVSSGVYFYVLKAGEFIQTRKMILNK